MLQKFITICFLLIVVTRIQSQVPEMSAYNADITIKAGDRLKLECPISVPTDGGGAASSESRSQSSSSSSGMQSGIMYEWIINNLHDISFTLNQKYSFENNSRVLRITKPVSGEDSGKYVCKGITGFGSKKAKFNIKVIDNTMKRLCATRKTNSNPALEPPCFVDPSMSSSSGSSGSNLVTREVGQSVDLSCLASGSAPVKYLWFQGRTIANWVQTLSGIRGPSLAISNLKSTYTGLYTCQVTNEAGSLNYTYRLVVAESPKNTPKILTRLANQSYSNGDKAVLTVRVQCECTNPIIKWLKQVDKTDQGDMKKIILPNARAAEKGEYFVTLDSGVVTKTKRRNVFESKLTLDPVDDKTRGKYIITAINKIVHLQHLEYDVIYLEVVNDKEPLKMKSNLVVYIAVPIVILLSSLGVIIYCCLRRHSGSGSGSGGGNYSNAINGHANRTAMATGGNGSHRRQQPYNYGNNNSLLNNGSSVNGSEKLKSPPSTTSTGFPSNHQQQQQQQQQQYPYKYTANNHTPSAPQSNYDQYSVLSASHSSNSTANNNNSTTLSGSNMQPPYYLPNPHLQQHHQQQQQQQQQYHHPNGYISVPLNQYPA